MMINLNDELLPEVWLFSSLISVRKVLLYEILRIFIISLRSFLPYM